MFPTASSAVAAARTSEGGVGLPAPRTTPRLLDAEAPAGAQGSPERALARRD